MNSFAEAFKDKFICAIDFQEPIGMVMQFNNTRTDSRIEKYIFVEGSTDELFFGNTNVEVLRSNTKYIWQINEKINNVKNEYVGKEGVYVAYRQIISDSELKKEVSKCIFIVDRDYDLDIASKNFEMTPEDKEHFTLSYGHSMENYFVGEENIRILFANLGVDEVYANAFWKMYLDFVAQSAEFFALKGAISYAYNKKISFDYKRKYDNSHIFSFVFYQNNLFEYNSSFMNEEIVLMETGIKNSKLLIKYYDKLYDLILENPQMIRGHDAFQFLHDYLLQVHNIDIKLIKRNILLEHIDKLNVDIEIK